jgi:hypothetical protein
MVEASLARRNRPDNEDIDEVFPRIYQSGYMAARNHLKLVELGITHILICTPYCKAHYPNEMKYLVLD